MAISAAKRGTGQAATAVFNPVYQTSGGTDPDAGAVAAAAAANGATGETVRNSSGNGDSEGGVKSQAVAGEGGGVALRPRAGVSDVGGEDSEEDEDCDDEDDDEDVDWEELEVGDGGGVLGAGRQALVDSDGDEGKHRSGGIFRARRVY